MTTLVSPQLAARVHARSRGVAGYFDCDEGLGRLPPGVVQSPSSWNAHAPPPPPPPPAPTAANPGTRTGSVIIADQPTAPAAPGGFAAIVNRTPVVAPAPIVPVYVPPAVTYFGVWDGRPESVPDDQVLSTTNQGRVIRTVFPNRAPQGQLFGSTQSADNAILIQRINQQLGAQFPGDTHKAFVGNPNHDTTALRTIGTIGTIATPIVAVVAPYAAPALAAISASALAESSGVASGNQSLAAGLTAGVGSAVSGLSAGGSGMNFATLLGGGSNAAAGGNPFGSLASGIAGSLGAGSDWANLIGGIAGSLVPGLLGGGGGGSAQPTPVPSAAPVAPANLPLPPVPTVEVTSHSAQSSVVPLVIGAAVLLALFAGGRRQ